MTDKQHSRGKSTVPDIDNNNTAIIATSDTTDKNIKYDSDAVHRAIEEFNRKKFGRLIAVPNRNYF